LKRKSRVFHRWIGIAVALPSLLVFGSGLLLQFKKQVSWIQPPTIRGESSIPTVKWDQILATARSSSQANIRDWKDIDRLDVRPSKGVIKVRAKNRWELQIDAASGELLGSAFRRSDLIESLHDGSFFSDYVKLFLFSANGFLLLGLLISGIYLWYLPIGARRRKRKRLSMKPTAIKDGAPKEKG